VNTRTLEDIAAKKILEGDGNMKRITLIDLFRSAYIIPERMDHIQYSLDQVRISSGLYLEFGVREGDSVSFIANYITPRIIYGFDSFEGIPEDWKRRKDGTLTYPEGTFSMNGVPEVKDNVRLIKGWFNITLPRFVNEHSEEVSFINIDSDLYSSAKTILTELNNQIIPGTIIYFDEITGWGDLIEQYDNWEEGEYKALVEWMNEFNREIIPTSRNNRYGVTVRVTR
jgi:hypothetical protein